MCVADSRTSVHIRGSCAGQSFYCRLWLKNSDNTVNQIFPSQQRPKVNCMVILPVIPSVRSFSSFSPGPPAVLQSDNTFSCIQHTKSGWTGLVSWWLCYLKSQCASSRCTSVHICCVPECQVGSAQSGVLILHPLTCDTLTVPLCSWNGWTNCSSSF